MKYNILIILSLLLLSACDKKETNSFTVQGVIKNANADMIFLEEASLTSNYPIIVDSAKLDKNGTFKLKTESAEENLYVLRLTQQVNPVATVINDNNKVTVNIDMKNSEIPYTVKNSPASEALVSYLSSANTKLSDIYNTGVRIDSLQTSGADPKLISELNDKRNAASSDFRNHVVSLIDKTKSPSLTIFAIGSYQSYASNPVLNLQPFSQEEMTDILNKASAKFPEHNGLASLKMNYLGQPQATAPAALLNKPAPDFTLNDVNGKPVSLSSFKGKYVLVDFWASWCAPCRAENPNVVNAFQQFNNKNFTILGVSLDKTKEPWVKAIKDDNLDWTHVSDLKFWESMVVPLYGINSIPYNVLLDPNGIVIAENLRGEDLVKTLSDKIKK